MDFTETITHLSLCSGYDGIGLALRSVFPNLREVAHVEIEAFAIANLVAKMETGKLDAAPIHTDLKTFPYSEFRGCVDILSGGFPCQPFSSAGKRQATEDPRHLFPYIAKGIAECRPAIVFLENVEGILSCRTGDGEPVLQYVLRTLEGMGYSATAGIFSASEVGASHQRKRVFILGVADAISARSQGSKCSRGTDAEGRQKSDGQPAECSTVPIARPEEQQYPHEEPRVVGHSTSKRLERRSGQSFQGTDQRPAVTNGNFGQTKPRLGRAVDGSSNRVDRLRLLGNGVVPATAAKAFKTLISRL